MKKEKRDIFFENGCMKEEDFQKLRKDVLKQYRLSKKIHSVYKKKNPKVMKTLQKNRNNIDTELFYKNLGYVPFYVIKEKHLIKKGADTPREAIISMEKAYSSLRSKATPIGKKVLEILKLDEENLNNVCSFKKNEDISYEKLFKERALIDDDFLRKNNLLFGTHIEMDNDIGALYDLPPKYASKNKREEIRSEHFSGNFKVFGLRALKHLYGLDFFFEYLTNPVLEKEMSYFCEDFREKSDGLFDSSKAALLKEGFKNIMYAEAIVKAGYKLEELFLWATPLDSEFKTKVFLLILKRGYRSKAVDDYLNKLRNDKDNDTLTFYEKENSRLILSMADEYI